MEKPERGTDPYEPPSPGAEAGVPPWDDTPADHAIVEGMHESRPFVMATAGIGVVAAVLVGLLAVVVLSSGSHSGVFPQVAILLLLAAGFFVPSVLLLRYGQSLQSAAVSRTVGSVVDAMQRQTSFWRAMAIATVLICVTFLGLFLWMLSTPWD